MIGEIKADNIKTTDPAAYPLRVEPADTYWSRVSAINARQEEKGLAKYGQALEDNTTLTREQRIEHLEEELIDGLKYCEHLKEVLGQDGITANDYQRAALRTAQADKLQWDELFLNGVMGLCGETGEVMDMAKKMWFQGHSLVLDEVAEELGDVAWYLAVAAHAVGYSLDDIFRMNIDKLKERYPDGFDKNRSIHREEG